MIGTYASAALICAVSLLVGRAILSLAGRREWSWLEPAVGLGAVLTATGLVARAPGHGRSSTLALAILVVAAVLVLWRTGARPLTSHAVARTEAGGEGAWREGLPVAVVVLLALSIPFVVSGRWGLLGVGFNNDLGLHLAWAEWLRSGFGPAPDTGYPLGPHGLAVATATLPGIGLGQAFLGEIIAIGVMTGLTALGALRMMSPGRRTLAAAMVALSYLGASYYAQGAFKELAEALLFLAFAIYLTTLDALRSPGDKALKSGPPDSRPPGTQPGAQRPVSGGPLLRAFLPPLALAGGIFFSYSFAGIAWPLAAFALWSLTLPAVRAALRPRTLLRLLLRPWTLVAGAALAGAAVLVTVVGPLGFAGTFNKVAGSNTYGPVSPIEALGVWPAANYRLDAAGGAELPGLAGAVAVIALLVGVAWWVNRREATIPIALGAGALLYLLSLPTSGDYSQAKALIIVSPLAMLVIVRPLLTEFPGRAATSTSPRRRDEVSDIGGQIGPSAPGVRRSGPWAVGWAVLAVAFVGGGAYSSFLVLRDAPVGPAGHGAELRSFLPIIHGEPVLYAGQDRYAAYELLGADTHVPLVEFPDPAVSPNPEKPFDTGDAYSPIDFDSFSRGTLDRVSYVITGRAAWNSQAPRNFKRRAATPSYVLWQRTGPTPERRHVLLEGTEAGAFSGCAAPEIRILLAEPGRASLFPDVVIGQKGAWDGGSVLGTDSESSQSLRLPAGRWNLSLQYFSPFDLTLSAPGFSESLKAALDGQRPNTISLGNGGQFWPAGRYESEGGAVRFTIATAEASALQGLTGYDGKAYLGELVAVAAEPHRIVPLAQACDRWLDWYDAEAAP